MRPSPLSPYLAATLVCACAGRDSAGAHDASPQDGALAGGVGQGAPSVPSSGLRASEPPAEVGQHAGDHDDIEFVRAFAATRGFRLGVPQKSTPTPDGKAVLFLRASARDPEQSLYELDLESGSTRRLVSPEALLGSGAPPSAAERAMRERLRVVTQGITDFELSRDGVHVAFVLSGRLFVFSRATGQTRELVPSVGGGISSPHFSPDGRYVAYVRQHDVHLAALDGSPEIAVTRGGTEAKPHGEAEFVAAEELGRSRGFWFSPDGTRIVYEAADTTEVETFTIADPANPAKPPDRNPYPRAGRANADVRLGIVPARAHGATTWIAWDRARFPYVATVTWTDDGPLTIYVLDRLQRHGLLLAVDPATGKTSTLLEERDEAWLNLDPSVPRWLPKRAGFLWSSERTGAWALELRDAEGAFVREVVPKELGYRELLDVDPERRTVLVIAGEEPTEAGIYSAPLDGGAGRWVMAAPGAIYSARVGADHRALAVTEVTRTSLPRAFVRTVDNPAERSIPSAAEAPSRLPSLEIVKVGADQVRVGIVRPRTFTPTKRYPVVDAAYAGPGVNMVAADAQRFLRAQWMADALDAIVVTIDGPGTPLRGRSWERVLANRLGRVPLEGHIATLSALGARYPEMDLSRVGAYGWSFGGYFSALAVLSRPDVYKVAVAGAPPVDWRDYDTAYTERYLGLPSDNAAAYDAASLLTYVKNAPRPSRPRLLLIHGTADDNVYFFNTLKLVDALQRAAHPFEVWPLAGTTHMLVDPAMVEAVWVRTAEFMKAGLEPTPHP